MATATDILKVKVDTVHYNRTYMTLHNSYHMQKLAKYSIFRMDAARYVDENRFISTNIHINHLLLI